MYSYNDNNVDTTAASNLEFKVDHSSKTKPKKRQNLQLWQFLLQLLDNNEYETIIEWSRKDAAEFVLLNPEEVNILF